MIRLYLRYRNSELQKLSLMIDSVLDELMSRSVITKLKDGSIVLAGGLSRLQCSNCFYISYLSDNEPRKCARCSAQDLHDFPKKK